jgi:hypothetical protein
VVPAAEDGSQGEAVVVPEEAVVAAVLGEVDAPAAAVVPVVAAVAATIIKDMLASHESRAGRLNRK